MEAGQPVYWRRKRETAKWHIGMQVKEILFVSLCGQVGGQSKGSILTAPIEDPWPDPRCPYCRRGEAAHRPWQRALAPRSTGARAHSNHPHQQQEADQ